ncbi:hypothetical protein B0H67DRAFT_243533 [Lasiosphaeris hirsuta]|uniref:Uncharacterized protein n=1 Tax=Lasiosphaeris hirsuta TaxID=260670 RepID=A0AA40DWF5_9PEZI|nr:hypothetical protein B0H67DRAFT_243533 [Lasiosphaeris hirsuta]
MQYSAARPLGCWGYGLCLGPAYWKVEAGKRRVPRGNGRASFSCIATAQKGVLQVMAFILVYSVAEIFSSVLSHVYLVLDGFNFQGTAIRCPPRLARKVGSGWLFFFAASAHPPLVGSLYLQCL